MLTQNAFVKSIHGDTLEVVVAQSGCGSCGVGCGVGKLSALFGKNLFGGGNGAGGNRLTLSNPGGYQVHDEVELMLEEAAFLRGIALQYILPLASMAVFVAAMSALSAIMWLEVVAAAAGLLCGIRIARRLLANPKGRFAAAARMRNLSRLTHDEPQAIKVIQR